jgi:hypothetical protein
MDKPEDNIRQFRIVKSTTDNEGEQQAYRKEAFDAFLNALQEQIDAGATGMVTLVFDKEGTPLTHIAGELDFYNLVGALDVTKFVVITNNLTFTEEGLD